MSSTVIKRLELFAKLLPNKCSVLYNKLISEMITGASSNVINCMKIMTYTVNIIKFQSTSFLKCLNVL